MTPRLEALPDDAVLVHIGPHKTGTTALQSMLARGREEMLAHGVLYPGSKGAHHEEARALRGLAAGWAHDDEGVPDPAIWQRLVDEVREAPGRVVISSEFFAQCNDEQRARLVREIGPERIHLLVAARNPAAIAVSTWQQILRQGHNQTLDQWLGGQFRRTDHTGEPSTFWFWADAALLAQRWSREVPADRMTVLVIDERDRLLLPATFEQLLGLPDGLLSGQEAKSNRGLTAPEAELFHELLNRIDGQLRWDEYTRIVRSGMLVRLVEWRKPPADEPKSAMPAWALEQSDRDATSIIERLAELPNRVVGDLEALRLGPKAAAEGPAPTTVPIDLAADALAGTMEAAAKRIRTLEAQLEKARTRADRLQRRGRAATAPSGSSLDGTGTRELAAELRRRVRHKVTPKRSR